MERNDIDVRFQAERLGPTETTCDQCGEVVLPSERRHAWDGEDYHLVRCDACHNRDNRQRGGA